MIFQNVSDLQEFSSGHRGMIYTGIYHGKKAIVKIAHPKSTATGNIGREALWLEKLNMFGIGPTLYAVESEYFIAEFIDGVRIDEYFALASSEDCSFVILHVLKQCKTLDELGINKEEMHHPYKHVLIQGKKVVMIDFERCKYTEKPHNVTQFVQYLCNKNVQRQLEKKVHIPVEPLRLLAEKYKKNHREFEKIVTLFA